MKSDRRVRVGPKEVGTPDQSRKQCSQKASMQQVLMTSHFLPLGIGCSLNSNPKFAGVHCTFIHRTHGVPTRKDTIVTRQLPFVFGFEFTDPCGGDSIARQRAFVGDSFNDE